MYMAKKITDGDLLKASQMMKNYDSTVYGANGKYAVGAYYDLYKGYKDSEQTEAAKEYENTIESDYLKKAAWLKEF